MENWLAKSPDLNIIEQILAYTKKPIPKLCILGTVMHRNGKKNYISVTVYFVCFEKCSKYTAYISASTYTEL